MRKTITLAALVAAVAMLVAAGPAAAKGKKAKATGPYSGTTTGGSSITLTLGKGGSIRNLSSSIFVSCSSLQSTTPKGGVEAYRPPAGLKLGTTEGEAEQSSALTWGMDVTKYYTTSVRKVGKTKLAGELKVSFSYFIPDLYNPRTYMCFGTTEFSAKKR